MVQEDTSQTINSNYPKRAEADVEGICFCIFCTGFFVVVNKHIPFFKHVKGISIWREKHVTHFYLIRELRFTSGSEIDEYGGKKRGTHQRKTNSPWAPQKVKCEMLSSVSTPK